MSDKPKAHGYIDNAALARAVRANQKLTQRVREFLEEGDVMSRTERYNLCQWLAIHLAEQRDALAQMERIRADARGGRAQ